MKKETGKQVVKTDNIPISGNLISDVSNLIETARHNVAATVNAGLTSLYWQIGNRIRQDILKEKRAEYGRLIVATLSRQLTVDYGNNFNEKNLRRMIQFAEVFTDKAIVVSLIRQLSWTHFIALIPLKDDLQRDFYAEMCRLERWSVRTLRKKIDGMLFERTAISKKPEELAKKELGALREEDRLAEVQDVMPLLADISDKKQEHFVCISLNGAHEVIEKRIVTIGLVDRSPVHPREVYADVISDRAAAVIFAHNHPSGDLKPSNSDLKIHEQLTDAGKILGIRILDNIIVAGKGYYSFQEAGLID